MWICIITYVVIIVIIIAYSNNYESFKYIQLKYKAIMVEK